jgi:hypothetical protein
VSRVFFSAFGDVACRSVDQTAIDIEKCAPSKPAERSVAATKVVFQVSDGDALCEPVDLRERGDPISGCTKPKKQVSLSAFTAKPKVASNGGLTRLKGPP